MQDKLEISDDEFNAAISPLDLKGRINLRLDAALQKELEDVADNNQYPFRSVSEVVRFCCLSGLERLQSWKPHSTLLGRIKAANALVLRDKFQCESVDLVARLEERVEWYIQREFFDEVVTIVAQVRGYFDGFPDDFWAQHMQSEIDSKFVEWSNRIDLLRKG